MRISARNIFKGKVTALKPGAVNSEVEITTPSGDRIVAVVTNESARSLGLSVGSQASALVKASSVLVMSAGDGVKLSARNCLPGNITKVTHGPVSADVAITLASGGTIHATITHDSAADMGLKPGIAATAVIKASSVIIAVEA